MTFPAVIPVTPVIDYGVRALCPAAYERHPKGCPNFGKAERCPPKAPLFDLHYDLSAPVFAVVNEFNLAAHMAKLAQTERADGSVWTQAQLRCVLYWQPAARKQLREKLSAVFGTGLFGGYEAIECPEAMGVDITGTLAAVGIHLEWPPVNIARQVALLAVPAP